MTTSSPRTAHRRPGAALALLGAVQFMIVLDITIVTVALTAIQADLGFSQERLQWVVSAYALVFGGFLLLAARAGDLLGRRRVLVLGLLLFAASSLLCGVAWDGTVLVAARALQGLGAAAVSPAALALLTTSFAEGPERNRALGTWGAVGSFGAAAGVLLGGIIVDFLAWEWIFLLNVPVGLAAAVLAPLVLDESGGTGPRRFDALGAALATGALVSLIWAFTAAAERGWASLQVAVPGVAAGLLLAAFVAWERRADDPLVPLAFLAARRRAAANVAGFLSGGMYLALFLLLTLHMQQELGYSTIEIGAACLVMRGTSIPWARAAPLLVERIGPRAVLALGMTAMAYGFASFAHASPTGSFVRELVPGLLATGAGISFLFVTIGITALEGVEPRHAGLASGLLNTSKWVGGAVGVATASSLAASAGLDVSLWACAGIALAGLAAVLVLLREATPRIGGGVPEAA